MQMEAELRELLLGHHCIDVMYYNDSHGWVFSFDGNLSLNADCPWRIIAENRIVLGCEDDGHQFGLHAPLDGRKSAMDRIGRRAICGVRTGDNTGDLCVEFEGGNLLELFSSSGCYEGWQCYSPELMIIGMGGGKIVLWEEPPGLSFGQIRLKTNKIKSTDD
jgi:hypothetical protein